MAPVDGGISRASVPAAAARAPLACHCPVPPRSSFDHFRALSFVRREGAVVLEGQRLQRLDRRDLRDGRLGHDRLADRELLEVRQAPDVEHLEFPGGRQPLQAGVP